MRIDDSLPPLAHRVTVFGSTRSIAATSAGVRSRFSGFIWVLTTAGPLTLEGGGLVTERDDTLALLTDIVLSQDVISHSVLLAFWLARGENFARQPRTCLFAGRQAKPGGLLSACHIADTLRRTSVA